MTHSTHGNISVANTNLLEDVVKDTNEQPDEEAHGLRSGRKGASVPMEYTTLPVQGCIHQPVISPNTFV